MTRRLLLKYLILICLIIKIVSSSEDYVDEEEQNKDYVTEEARNEDYVAGEEDTDTRKQKMINIYKLRDRCVQNRCSGFNFENIDEIAFFDLQTEVRIAPDGATYDIGEGETKSHTLIFENSTFANFPLHLFYALDLSELDMRNCQIEHISWECFLMANRLQILLLSDNRVEKLDEMTFNYASELQYLFLSGNKLKQLNAKSFNGLKKLRHLDLSDNRLEDLPLEIFRELNELQELNLAENRLRVIDNKHFAYNSKLLTVTLHTNRLREIGEYAFREQMSTMMHLVDLSHNQQLDAIVLNVATRFLRAANCSLYRVNIYGTVRNVDLRDNHLMELYFSEPEQLETLILRNNALLQIASLSLAKKLDFLDLADNPDLGELPNPWQADGLRRLDLSNTSLKVLPITSLSTLPNLRNLNVSNNQLSEINPQNFKYLDKLTHFYIQANNWNCYSLNIIMDLLIKPFDMSYTVDRFDPDFPGEYVNDIACMYRLEEASDESDEYSSSTSSSRNNNFIKPQDQQQQQQQLEKDKLSMDPALAEIAELRKEMKAIVGIYEQKFARVYEMLNDLNAKMRTIESINNTLWQQMTILV